MATKFIQALAFIVRQLKRISNECNVASRNSAGEADVEAKHVG